jgi:hypothetical protein
MGMSVELLVKGIDGNRPAPLIESGVADERRTDSKVSYLRKALCYLLTLCGGSKCLSRVQSRSKGVGWQVDNHNNRQHKDLTNPALCTKIGTRLENVSKEGEMSENNFCDDCEYLSPKESEQGELKEPHCCLRVAARLYHHLSHPHIPTPEWCPKAKDSDIARLKEEVERMKKNEAVCHCGDPVSKHNMGSGHAPVEMPVQCPFEQALAAAEAREKELREKVERAIKALSDPWHNSDEDIKQILSE